MIRSEIMIVCSKKGVFTFIASEFAVPVEENFFGYCNLILICLLVENK